MNTSFNSYLFEQMPIIGILRGYDLEIVLKIASLYQEAGFSTLEITMNSPGATATIARLNEAFPNLNIGAGTVCNQVDLEEALTAGASFIVTPILDIGVIESCVDRNIPVFPGAMTPTEIYQAWKAGATGIKVFPATQFGPSYIKELLGPLDQLKLLPTGGISKENVLAYFKAGATGVGVGGGLFVSKWVAAGDYASLSEHFREFEGIVRQYLDVES